MKKIRLATGVMILLAFVLVMTGCAKRPATPAPQPVKKFKVAFVYPGTIYDKGWSQAHDQGRKYLQQQLPDVETNYMEAVSVGADAERVLVELAEKGNKVIFAADSDYADAVLKVARQYPNAIFMICSGNKTASNVGTYDGRMYQPRYLSGLVAGSMTKTNLIGYVAMRPNPAVNRDINAFALGVRAVNAKAKVKVVWTNDCLKIQKEKDAIKSLLKDGADIIVQQRDDPAVQQPAAEKGTLFIGSDGDLSKPLPGADLINTGWNWGPLYATTVKAVRDGTWNSSQIWGAMSDRTVDLSPLNPVVPGDVRQLVDDKKRTILNGKWDVFRGPVKDQKGLVRVKAGQNITDSELMSMDWFVPGVEGTNPKK